MRYPGWLDASLGISTRRFGVEGIHPDAVEGDRLASRDGDRQLLAYGGLLKDLGWNYNFTPTLSIPDMTLFLNKAATLDLWDYTTDENDALDTLSYSLIGTGGSTMLISGTARISGTHYLYIEPQSSETVRDIEVQVVDPDDATDNSLFQVTFVEKFPLYLPFVIRN